MPLQDLETQLALVHHTPKQVEQFGVEPVPPEKRTVRWIDLAAMMFAFELNPLGFLLAGIGVEVGKLPFWPAFFAPVLGNAITFLAFVTIGTFGVDYGIPGQVGARSFFGNWGARIFTSAFRVLTSVYYFAAVTLAGALGISALLQNFGVHISAVVIAVILAILQSTLAVIGFDVVRYFVRAVFPLMAIVLILMGILLLTSHVPAFSWGTVQHAPGTVFTWGTFALFASINGGSWMSTLTDAADLCRYSKNRGHMWAGYWVGAVVGTAFISFLGVFAATATHNWNPFSAVASLHPSTVIVVLMMVSLRLQTVSVNILNHYTGGFSLVNTFPVLGRFWATVLVAVVGIVATGFPTFINHAQNFLTLIGNLASPLAGVMLTDYLLLKKTHMDVIDLFQKGRYWYWGGFNPAAIVSAGVGFFLFSHVPPAWMPDVATVVITGVMYWVLVRVIGAVWGPMRTGTVPADAPVSFEVVEEISLGTNPNLT